MTAQETFDPATARLLTRLNGRKASCFSSYGLHHRTVSLVQRTQEQASNVHDTEFPSADAERVTMTGHDRQTGQPAEEHDKIRIRLRL